MQTTSSRSLQDATPPWSRNATAGPPYFPIGNSTVVMSNAESLKYTLYGLRKPWQPNANFDYGRMSMCGGKLRRVQACVSRISQGRERSLEGWFVRTRYSGQHPRPPRSPPHLLLALPFHRIIVEMRIGGLGIRVLHARQSSRGGHQKRRVDRRRSCEFDIML